VQIFLVARLFRKVGVGSAIVLVPLLSVVGYGAAVTAPLLAIVTVVKVGQDGAEYSLQNTGEQALFLRTSRDAKYKGKAAIDTLFVRLGDLVATGAIFVGSQLGLRASGYAVMNVALSAAWLWIALKLRALHGGERERPQHGYQLGA
jgi:ATP:ADP antiporter, AAA family